MPPDIFEQIQLFLPRYLSDADRRRLFDELASFPSPKGFYLHPDAVDEELLQGDGWQGLIALNFHTLERRSLSGLIISNSCDVDVRNFHGLPTNVLFAPLISLARYAGLLKANGRTAEQVDSKLASIRAQQVTSIFYLPAGQHGPEESMVMLDDIHAHPLPHFLESDRTRLFRLGQYGFYILLMKLSIHLSRFQEGVRRFA